jgi:hypothetical protein
MPEFQRKRTRFPGTMNWNATVDAIPEGQLCYARNVRVTQQGTMINRPGFTLFSNLGTGVTHSIARLNNYNTTLINFTQVKVVGRNFALHVGDTGANLANATINPVRLPPAGSTSSLSGLPLTMVDMAPVGASYGWKYIGDANMNLAVGYYPGDEVIPGTGNNGGMARAMTMGMTPPVNTTIPTDTGAGLLNGDYQWMFAYRNRFTGARSNPSAPTRVTLANPALTLTLRVATMTTPQTPIDPITGAADANIIVDIYRFGGTIQDWRYVGTAAGNTVFNDNLPDSEILTNPGPPSITDPVTGVQRFNIYRPFITQDVPRYSTVDALMSQEAVTGKWLLQPSGTPPNAFNLNWIPGSTISINNKIFTIFQVRSVSVLEIVEDATGSITSGTTVPWATQTTLTAGAPLPHIWGPYGTGSGGAYIFGCGNAADTGTLYWTNGNDPDSTDIANSLIVTSPSEPLRGGCVYDGTPFCWSTERMFRIYPGATPGQFTVQEVPGGKGIWAEWSLTVQSNGISDQSVTWVGKDGIYDWSTSGGLHCLTDKDLYPFFPHDNQNGYDLVTIFPFLNEPVAVNAPTFTDNLMRYHRLCWFMGELFYDFPGGSGAGLRFNTLVFDSKEAGGWVSLDQYASTAGPISTAPTARGIEIAANNLLVAIGGDIYNYTGQDDHGVRIPCRVVTRQDDLGDPRAQKFLGDYMMDTAAGDQVGDLFFTPLVDYTATQLVSGGNTSAGRFQVIDTFRTLNQQGYLSPTVGFDITWTTGTGLTALYQYEIAFVPKPEWTINRPTDPTDDSYNGAKYLRGFCIECNTMGVTRAVDLWVDNASVGTFTVTANRQLEIPIAIDPVVGSEFWLLPLDQNQWEIFQIRWTWEKWPDYTALFSPWMNLGTTKPKYVRGFSIPVDTNSAPVEIRFAYMDRGVYTYFDLPIVTTPSNRKSRVSFAVGPLVADQIQLWPAQSVRCWYDEIIWDAEEWPNLIVESYPFQDCGSPGAKYLRGLEVPVETNGVPATIGIRSDQDNDFQAFGPVASGVLIKSVFPFTPAVPMIGHEFQLRSETAARVWWQEAKWDFEPWPEFSAGRGAWTDMGTPGAKFLQGMVIPMDTGGRDITMQLLYDHSQSLFFGPFNTPAGTKTAEPYSLPLPVIVHEVQVVPLGDARVWFDQIKWVWEPIPELVTTYTTQPTDHDLPGWHYLFDAYIAYIGTADPPIFSVTTEHGTINYPLPVANGTYTRAYLLLHPQKAKWRSYSIISGTGLRLFLKDCEVRAKNWTDKGNYPAAFQSYHPFGDESRVYGARI